MTRFKMTYKMSKVRLIASVDGVVVYRGPTFRQLRRLHKHGNCKYDCGHCYYEACGN